MARFAEIGFPTLHQEEWRKTSIAPILKVPFRPQPAYVANGFTAQAIERYRKDAVKKPDRVRASSAGSGSGSGGSN